MNLTATQKRTVLACFLGWMLDAFDFFVLVFVLNDIAKELGAVEIFGVSFEVSWALFFTLATRFIGAFIFGRIGDRIGRKPALMLNIICYSVLGAAAAFSPNLIVFFALRALFGVAMGGEWGLGSSLAMESIPPQARGIVSGILQCGYPTGYLLASIAYGLLYQLQIGSYTIDWRGMFLLSILPAFAVLFIRSNVPESPAFVEAQKGPKPSLVDTLRANWGIALYSVVLMMCFNFFSHGTQDLYPRFLQTQRQFDHHTVFLISVVANIGAIVGGLFFGSFSERIGRVNAITIASAIALPVIPLWAYSSTPFMLAIGAFIMQIAVQGAWGVIPAHLNELSPGPVRATLPAFVYQAGNLLAAVNGPVQTAIAQSNGNNYSFALSLVVAIVAVAIIVVIRFSPERRGEVLSVAH
jgi:SHS family lactate transporter-like MFS transporter